MRRQKIKYSLLFGLAMILAFPVYSQYTVAGRVMDQTTGEALPGAHVLVDGTLMSAATGPDGLYSISGLKQGDHKFKVSFVGFRTLEVKIELQNDRTLDFRLEPQTVMSEEVIVQATRAREESPTAYTSVDKEDIESQNLGQDLPYILQITPSVVTSSDAGAGVGYTGIRIRGTDITRINVTMNGVPVNDAESQGVYFVDLPDLASSVDNIQIQRGVGTSTNGAAAFGASINIQTTTMNADPYAEISSAAGSFNTLKNTLNFGSGLIDGKWTLDGRLSAIQSDGYIDRGWSNLKSFYLSGGYYGSKSILKAIVTSGWEKTYQAWYGIPKDSLETNRRYNPSGEMLDEEGNIIGYYDNQTDNYQQDYYQLHFAHQFSRALNLSSAVFYTKGKGYYESYRNMDSYSDYGFENVVIGNDTITRTNLIRQKWLDNDFYGFNLSLNLEKEKFDISVGTGWNKYAGDHFGYIIWAEHASNSFIDKPWYENTGSKQDYHIFGKIDYRFTGMISLYGDFQYRAISYKMKGIHDNLRDLTQSHSFNFFNPKGGVFISVNEKNSLYASVAVAHREPNRSVYRDADPGQKISSEHLVDFELGYKFNNRNLNFEANYYYMDYKDQLVLTGQINNVGDPILVSVPQSYRTGIELIGGLKITNFFRWDMNATLSRNKINDFTAYTDNWDTWPEQVEESLGTTDISFSPDIIANNSLNFVPFKNFSTVLLSKYVSRQYIDNTSSKERSLDPYFVNDLKFFYTVTTRLIREINFTISLNNIFNVEYETNAWVYRYFYANEEYELNGFFPQAKFNFMCGVILKF
ncbi:MAG: TonB-dependent receptor [Bacteroidales bacterium]|nr:TonB-dependent receptor [Bacteroidales bacterium]